MRAVSTVLTFWIVVVPLFTMAALFAGIIFLYQPSFEATVVVQALTAMASLAFADLLVWERLRDSLSKKLEYIHSEYLAELYSSFKKRTLIDFWKQTVERTKPDLKRYGKFMGIISLYPKDLLNKVDRFLIPYEQFNNRFVKVKSMGEEHCETKFNEYLWCHVLGIESWEGALLKQNSPVLKLHEERALLVKEKHVKLIEETKEYLEIAEKLQKEILERLEDFFKSNNLEMPEPRYDI